MHSVKAHLIKTAVIYFMLLLLNGCSVQPPKSAQTPDRSVAAAPTKNPRLQSLIKSSPAERSGQPVLEADVWAVIKNGLVFERHLNHPKVSDKVAWFAGNQAYLDRMSKRAHPYLFYIVSELKARNMPLDLALLPIIESAYNPFAYSPSHASGLWQFIPATGRHYGMQQNWWYDGRRDVIAATKGALDYLQVLHKRFDGDWFLALAAYNAGEGNVGRAIKKNKKRGRKTDFWSLPLPAETKRYVPSVLAAAEVLKHSEQYNIRFTPIPNSAYFASVDIGGQLDLASVAELAELNIQEIYTLNPGFNQWATPPEGPHRLLLPLTKVKGFKQKLARLPDAERMRWQRHIIRRGESLSQIAAGYQISVSGLKAANRLRKNTIYTGDALLIPIAKKGRQFYSLSADARRFRGLKKTANSQQRIYTVKRGDNLWDISRRYGLYVKQLVQWNKLNPKSILRPGQKLTIWIGQAVHTVASQLVERSYTVKRGDSLWLIAKKFDVLVEDLRKWNRLKEGSYLYPGQNLILPAKG